MSDTSNSCVVSPKVSIFKMGTSVR